MTEYKYICLNHRLWVDSHPKEAFNSVQKITKMAEKLLRNEQPERAIPFLGTAYETAEIIFDKRLESPQLTNSLTSLAIMLAHAYASTNQLASATDLLQRLHNKMQCAINCAIGYSTKVAFFEHCARAINDASDDIKFHTLPMSNQNTVAQHLH